MENFLPKQHTYLGADKILLLQALSLLKASLISKAVLTDVFYATKPKDLGKLSPKKMAASARAVKTDMQFS